MSHRPFRAILVALATLLIASVAAVRAEPVAWQDAERIRAETAEVVRRLYRSPDDGLRRALADRTAGIAALWRGPLAAAYAPHQAGRITQSIDDLSAAVARWDPAAASAARATLWTGMLDGAFQATLRSIDGDDTRQAAAWLNIREYARTSRDTAATIAMAELQAGRLETARAREIIEAELLGVYASELRRAVAETRNHLAAGHPVQFAASRARAFGLAGLLSANLKDRLGPEPAASLDAAFAALGQAASDDEANISTALATIEAALATYAPVSLSGEERERRVRLLARFVALVPVEYEKGVEDGEVTIPFEYFEATLFRDRAAMLLGDLGHDLAGRAPAAQQRLSEILSAIKTIMTAKGDEAEVKALAAEAVALVGTVYGAASIEAGPAAALSLLPDVLDELLATARAGDWENAELKRLEAYALFDPDIEQRLMPRAPALALRMEADFWEGTVREPGLGQLIAARGPAEPLAVAVTRLKAATAEAAATLDTRLSAVGAFLQSFAILLREGLEAVLVLACLVGALKAGGVPASGAGGWRLPLFAGVITAVAGSFALWLLVGRLFEMTTLEREFLEGATALVAAAVLIYVTHQIFHRTYVGAWLAGIRQQAARVSGAPGGTLLRQTTVLSLAFMVVFREGFETVLFYEALLAEAPPIPVLAGLGAGAAAAAAVTYAMLQLERQLPVAAFFRLTGAMLTLLAIMLVGGGIRGLQTAALLPATPVAWFPDAPWLQIYFGLYPVAESLAAQAAVAGLLAMSALWPLARSLRCRLGSDHVKAI